MVYTKPFKHMPARYLRAGNLYRYGYSWQSPEIADLFPNIAARLTA
jgi:hypothetical protein